MKSSKVVKTSKKPAIIIPTMISFYLHIYFTVLFKGSKRFYNLIGILMLPLIMMKLKKSKRFYKTNSVPPRIKL